MSEKYQAVFHSGEGDALRQMAEVRCIENGLRLEDDGFIYNAFGIRVAKYLGHDGNGGLRFENLRLETEWENAKVFKGEG